MEGDSGLVEIMAPAAASVTYSQYAISDSAMKLVSEPRE